MLIRIRSHKWDGLPSRMLRVKIFGLSKYEDCRFNTCYGCPFIRICYKDMWDDEEGSLKLFKYE